MLFMDISRLFNVDGLAITMLTWTLFLGTIIYFFSKRYMKGDAEYSLFFRKFWIVITSFIVFILSNHLAVLLLSLLICHWSFYHWLSYKTGWHAAVASSQLALRYWMSGFVCMSLGFIGLNLATGGGFIDNIPHTIDGSWYIQGALAFVFFSAMVQSGTWPFHRWLVSSQNAPTPTLAIMHGMLLNANAYLFIRLAPLYACAPKILNMVFVLGLCSTLIGFGYSCIQSDVKRNLACSTICHMGLVWVQCGLGLFAPALAYFFWHGLFKASLFLASGSAAQENHTVQPRKVFSINGLLALLCSGLGSYAYIRIIDVSWVTLDTRLWIVLIGWLSIFNVSLEIMGGNLTKQRVLAMIASLILPILYAINIDFFNGILPQMQAMSPQPLSTLHRIGFIILVGSWLGMSWFQSMLAGDNCPNWVLRLYILASNASQPHPKTVTSYRKGYDYV